MNVTERQKKIIITFMREHPDFGRGRIRYNRNSKKIMDELWEQLTNQLNSSGAGPRKCPKEWAKTWRDWKSNFLKRLAAYKNYAAGTGGGPPKILDLSASEEDLMSFLTPEACGLPNIPEGGAFPHENISTESPEWQIPIAGRNTCIAPNKTPQKYDTMENLPINISTESPEWQIPIAGRNTCIAPNKTPQKYDTMENLPINISTESPEWQIPIAGRNTCIAPNKAPQKYDTMENLPINISTESPEWQIPIAGRNTCIAPNKTPQKYDTMENLPINISTEAPQQQYGGIRRKSGKMKYYETYNNHASQNIKLQQEMLALEREKLELKKAIHKENTELRKEQIEIEKKRQNETSKLLTTLIEEMREVKAVMKSFAPEYLVE